MNYLLASFGVFTEVHIVFNYLVPIIIHCKYIGNAFATAP